MASLLNYILMALLAGAVLTNCGTGRALEKERAARVEETSRRVEAVRLAEAGHRQRERDFAAQSNKITTDAAHEKLALERRISALSHSLRNRPDRPAGDRPVPADSAGDLGCSGDRLYRQDGEFLVGEDAAAENNLVLLYECRARYDAAFKLTTP